MTKTHAAGAADSYGMRYLLRKIFNVAVGNDDKDGNTPPPQELPTISDAQKKELMALIERGRSTQERFCTAMKIEAIDDLLAAHFENAKGILMDRIRKIEARAPVDPKAQFDAMERSNA